jgi:hypothetical protein
MPLMVAINQSINTLELIFVHLIIKEQNGMRERERGDRKRERIKMKTRFWT